MVTLRSSAFMSFLLGFFMLLQSSGHSLDRVESAEAVRFSNILEGQDIRTPDQIVAVEVFTRFDCRECERLAKEVLPKLRSYDYGVATPVDIYVLADPSIASQADPAKAIYCADQQQKWEMRDALFALDAPVGLDQAREAAQDLEMDMAAYEACLNSEEATHALESAQQKAQERQIDTFPTLLVNQHRLLGFQPWENIERILNL